MVNFVKLDTIDHADLKVAVRQGAAFGDAVNQVLVFPTEFEQLQREYPILFRRDERGGFYAVALLGLDLDENLFLGPDGWQGRYVPAVRQCGPFRSSPENEEGDEPSLHVDLDDPRVGTDEGEPLFLRHGGHSPYLRHVAAVLDAVHRGARSTAPFFTSLVEHDLIRPVALDISLDDGVTYNVADVFTVDNERLAALSGAPLERLHGTGVLRAATMVATSIGNIDQLIALKTAPRQ